VIPLGASSFREPANAQVPVRATAQPDGTDECGTETGSFSELFDSAVSTRSAGLCLDGAGDNPDEGAGTQSNTSELKKETGVLASFLFSLVAVVPVPLGKVETLVAESSGSVAGQMDTTVAGPAGRPLAAQAADAEALSVAAAGQAVSAAPTAQVLYSTPTPGSPRSVEPATTADRTSVAESLPLAPSGQVLPPAGTAQVLYATVPTPASPLSVEPAPKADSASVAEPRPLAPSGQVLSPAPSAQVLPPAGTAPVLYAPVPAPASPLSAEPAPKADSASAAASLPLVRSEEGSFRELAFAAKLTVSAPGTKSPQVAAPVQPAPLSPAGTSETASTAQVPVAPAKTPGQTGGPLPVAAGVPPVRTSKPEVSAEAKTPEPGVPEPTVPAPATSQTEARERSAEPSVVAKAAIEHKTDEPLRDAVQPLQAANPAESRTPAPNRPELPRVEPPAAPGVRNLDALETKAPAIAERLPSAPVREVSIEVPGRTSAQGAPQTAQLKLVERGGEVYVAVRTPDGELAQSLRQHLGQLAARLEESGYRTETWRPVEAVAAGASTGGDVRRESGRGSFSDPDSGGNRNGSAWSGGENRQQQRDSRDRPSWIEYLENEQNAAERAARSILHDNRR
jgi:hypothetical protein